MVQLLQNYFASHTWRLPKICIHLLRSVFYHPPSGTESHKCLTGTLRSDGPHGKSHQQADYKSTGIHADTLSRKITAELAHFEKSKTLPFPSTTPKVPPPSFPFPYQTVLSLYTTTTPPSTPPPLKVSSTAVNSLIYSPSTTPLTSPPPISTLPQSPSKSPIKPAISNTSVTNRRQNTGAYVPSPLNIVTHSSSTGSTASQTSQPAPVEQTMHSELQPNSAFVLPSPALLQPRVSVPSTLLPPHNIPPPTFSANYSFTQPSPSKITMCYSLDLILSMILYKKEFRLLRRPGHPVAVL